jgi:hypothetical protein
MKLLSCRADFNDVCQNVPGRLWRVSVRISISIKEFAYASRLSKFVLVKGFFYSLNVGLSGSARP